MKHLTARLDRVLELGQANVAGDSLRLAQVEAFEQSPKCSLLAAEGTLRIVAANEAMRLVAGCSEKQISRLSIADLFRDEGDRDSLLQQLRNPNPRLPIKAWLRTGDGVNVDVEIIGYRVRTGGRTLLAFLVEDLTSSGKSAARPESTWRAAPDLA